MLVIDPLSVATNGFQESGVVGPVTPGPKISSPRDELRIATNGWIIVDFAQVPDAGTVICVGFLTDGATDCVVEDHLTSALVFPILADADVEPAPTAAEVKSGVTIAELPSSETDAEMEGSTDATMEGRSGAEVERADTGAGMDQPSTGVAVPPKDTDFDPQDQC